MRDIKTLIKESTRSDWHLISDMRWSANASFIFLYPDEYLYGFCTENKIEELGEDSELDPEDIQEILNLKPGKSYTNDGENIYIRIKK